MKFYVGVLMLAVSLGVWVFNYDRPTSRPERADGRVEQVLTGDLTRLIESERFNFNWKDSQTYIEVSFADHTGSRHRFKTWYNATRSFSVPVVKVGDKISVSYAKKQPSDAKLTIFVQRDTRELWTVAFVLAMLGLYFVVTGSRVRDRNFNSDVLS
jgi:hypothetical protein